MENFEKNYHNKEKSKTFFEKDQRSASTDQYKISKFYRLDVLPNIDKKLLSKTGFESLLMTFDK
jgi:hypothetical protein